MACPYCLSTMIYLGTDNLLHCQYCGDSFTQFENWVDDCIDDDLPPLCPDCGAEMTIFDDEAEKYFCPNCGGSINA